MITLVPAIGRKQGFYNCSREPLFCKDHHNTQKCKILILLVPLVPVGSRYREPRTGSRGSQPPMRKAWGGNAEELSWCSPRTGTMTGCVIGRARPAVDRSARSGVCAVMPTLTRSGFTCGVCGRSTIGPLALRCPSPDIGWCQGETRARPSLQESDDTRRRLEAYRRAHENQAKTIRELIAERDRERRSLVNTRLAVEELRNMRASHEARCVELRTERDQAVKDRERARDAYAEASRELEAARATIDGLRADAKEIRETCLEAIRNRDAANARATTLSRMHADAINERDSYKSAYDATKARADAVHKECVITWKDRDAAYKAIDAGGKRFATLLNLVSELADKARSI